MTTVSEWQRRPNVVNASLTGLWASRENVRHVDTVFARIAIRPNDGMKEHAGV